MLRKSVLAGRLGGTTGVLDLEVVGEGATPSRPSVSLPSVLLSIVLNVATLSGVGFLFLSGSFGPGWLQPL